MMGHLFNTDKIKYVTGNRPDVQCILCAIRDMHPDVTSLEIAREKGFIITVNLYPFNPGHLMIFPERHVSEFESLTADEASVMHGLLVRTVKALRDEFRPTGFNIGFNIGRSGGASISHIHQHVVPRYDHELGFLDVISGTRIMVIDPVEVRERLIKRFSGA